MEVHGDIHLSPKASKLRERLRHIEPWERQLERYYEMGRQAILPDEKCVIVLKMFLMETTSSLVMQLEDYIDSDCFKAKLEKQVTFLADHHGSHSLRVQLVDGAASDAPYGHRAPTGLAQ